MGTGTGRTTLVGGVASLMLLSVSAPGWAQDAKSAESFLRHLYAAYHAKGKGVDLLGPGANKVFAPSLAKLMRDDVAAAEGEVGAIDGDPICMCQDFDIKTVAVTAALDGPGKAKASAHFSNLGHEKTVSFDLVAVTGAWRVADIHSDDVPSLRQALEEDIATLRAAKEKH